MLPVLSGSVKESGEIKVIIAKELDVETEDIYGMDLFLFRETVHIDVEPKFIHHRHIRTEFDALFTP